MFWTKPIGFTLIRFCTLKRNYKLFDFRLEISKRKKFESRFLSQTIQGATETLISSINFKTWEKKRSCLKEHLQILHQDIWKNAIYVY